MRLLAGLTLVLGLAAGQSPPPAPGGLAAVRALYASAAYEEALNRLTVAEASADPIDVAQLRALCWIGLGNLDEAERVLESLVWRAPEYVISDSDVSPRLVSLFRDVRRRLLPTVAADLLAGATTLYEKGQFVAASGRLDELFALIASEETAAGSNPDGRIDLTALRVVADGLRDLVKAEVSRLPDAPEPVVFSSADRDVISPVEISRAMPHWTPPRESVPPGLYQGLLEVVINEQGRVESPVMRRPVHPTYDRILLAATADWRFQPAVKDGEAVRYRKFFEIILHTRKSGGES